MNSYTKMKTSKRNRQRKLDSCRYTPKVNKVLVEKTHPGRHKKTIIYVIVRGSIYYFKNISLLRLWAEGWERKGNRKIHQESSKQHRVKNSMSWKQTEGMWETMRHLVLNRWREWETEYSQVTLAESLKHH